MSKTLKEELTHSQVADFPAQFRHLAAALGADPNNQVIFGTNRQDGQMPKVQTVVYDLTRQPNPDTHRYLAPMERAVLEGQAVYRVCHDLKREGFYPDAIYCGTGDGTLSRLPPTDSDDRPPPNIWIRLK